MKRTALALLVTLGTAAMIEIALRVAGFGHPVLYENRSAYGYRPLPDQTRRRFGGAHVHINNLGTRGPDVSPRPAAGMIRLLFLGDSVTYGGSYVDDGQLLSAVAARTLGERRRGGAGVEALDAGVNGWGPANMLGFVRATDGFGSGVWVVIALDADFWREKTHLGEVPYLTAPPRFASEEILVLGAYRLLTAYRRPKPADDLTRLARRNLAVYRLIAIRGAARGARVVFVWHPREDVVAGAPEHHHAALAGMAAAMGAPLLDLTPAYRAATGARLYVDGLHLTAAGHAVAGRAIGDWLADVLP